MLVRCIIVQRNCRYPGEYQPELWDAWSEYVLEDNPDGYAESLGKAHNILGSELTAVRELEVIISEGVIDNLFRVPTTVANINRNPNRETVEYHGGHPDARYP